MGKTKIKYIEALDNLAAMDIAKLPGRYYSPHPYLDENDKDNWHYDIEAIDCDKLDILCNLLILLGFKKVFAAIADLPNWGTEGKIH